MNFRYKQGSRWVTSTPKVRQGSQWVAVDMLSSRGDFDSPSGWVNPDYLLTGDPPTRSNTVYTSNYSGLQDALNSIGEDTRLVIDDGPYTGNFDLPQTSHITLDGDGTTLTASDSDDAVLRKGSTGNEFDTTSSAGRDYSAGQSSITVNDGSIFSAGDIIRLYSNQDHPDQPLTGSGGDGEQGLYHVVESVSGDTLTLEEDLLLDWDNPRVDNVEWGAEDIRLTNLTLDGDDVGRNGRPGRIVRFYRTKGIWVDNCTIQNGCTGLWIHMCFQIRVHNCVLDELGVTADDGTRGYPVDFVNGSHHAYITDCESYASQRYGFKSGSGAGMWPARNGRIENCHAEPDYQRAYDQHQGSHHWEYIDCTVAGQGFGRDRSDGYYAKGGGVDSPGGLCFYARGAHDARTHIEQQHYVNISNTHHVYRLLDDGDNQRKRVTFVDVWAETSESINEFFKFSFNNPDGGGSVELTINNVALDGTWITESNGSDHYVCDAPIDVSITSPSDGRSPSEYFSDEYGWSSGTLF